MSPFKRLVLTIILACTAVLQAVGGRLYVTPSVCFAPCNVEVRVSPPEEGANLLIEVASDTYYTSHVGPKPSYTRVYGFNRLPAGDYTIRARAGHWDASSALKVVDAAH